MRNAIIGAGLATALVVLGAIWLPTQREDVGGIGVERQDRADPEAREFARPDIEERAPRLLALLDEAAVETWAGTDRPSDVKTICTFLIVGLGTCGGKILFEGNYFRITNDV